MSEAKNSLYADKTATSNPVDREKNTRFFLIK